MCTSVDNAGRKRTESTQMTNSNKPKTAAEIAAYFEVSERTVRRWIDAGCPVMNPSAGVFRFDLADVIQWCKTQRATTKAVA